MILARLRCLKKIASDIHFGAKYRPLFFLLFKVSSYPSTLNYYQLGQSLKSLSQECHHLVLVLLLIGCCHCTSREIRTLNFFPKELTKLSVQQ